MTTERKNQIIDSIMNILIELTENTVRLLVAQDKVKYVRTGKGKRGKILVNKADLISYFQK